MIKRSRRNKRLLLDKEVLKLLTTVTPVAGGAKTFTTNPPDECIQTSEMAETC